MQLPTTPSMLVSDEDAWGIEDDTLNTTSGPKGAAANHALRQRLLSSRQASVSTGAVQLTGSYSLQAYCLGCLGQYVEELLLSGSEVLPYLPPDAKASLMAIARRQGLLTSGALNLLVDSSWTSLDVSNSSVADTAVQAALQCTPHLLSLDLTGCAVSQRTVRSLGEWCPQLQVLRIGCNHVRDDHAWNLGLKHIMPTVVQTADATESWEALASPLQHAGTTTLKAASDEKTTSRLPSYSQLSQLRHLIWPSIPIRTAELLAKQFPRVVVNPAAGSCVAQADPAIALDEAAMFMIAPFWEQEQIQEPIQSEHIVPLSEKFRMAYVSRAERVAAKAERNYQQRKRRELRNDTVLQALARFKFL